MTTVASPCTQHHPTYLRMIEDRHSVSGMQMRAVPERNFCQYWCTDGVNQLDIALFSLPVSASLKHQHSDVMIHFAELQHMPLLMCWCCTFVTVLLV
jgi:hypothetical protein